MEKVPEVKDTVHKQSLLHHACSIVVEKFPDSTDLYSEIGAITRLTKVSLVFFLKNNYSWLLVAASTNATFIKESSVCGTVVRWTLTSFKTIWPRWSEGAKHHGITSRSLQNMR